MKGWWRMDEKTQDTSRGSQEIRRDIQRAEALKRHFTAAEIDRLIMCQVRYRERGDALDLPADLHRLRFARWLVERGKLTEDVDADEAEAETETVASESGASDEAATDEAATDEPGRAPHAHVPLKYTPASYWYAQPRRNRSPSFRGGGWRRSLANLMSRLRGHQENARPSGNTQKSSSPSTSGG